MRLLRVRKKTKQRSSASPLLSLSLSLSLSSLSLCRPHLADFAADVDCGGALDAAALKAAAADGHKGAAAQAALVGRNVRDFRARLCHGGALRQHEAQHDKPKAPHGARGGRGAGRAGESESEREREQGEE